jgi:hypothetical protein
MQNQTASVRATREEVSIIKPILGRRINQSPEDSFLICRISDTEGEEFVYFYRHEDWVPSKGEARNMQQPKALEAARALNNLDETLKLKPGAKYDLLP